MSTYQYEKISRTIFKSLRGDQSQKDFGSKLGLGFNQWHKFESGQKNIMWSDLYSLAIKLNIPIDETVLKITGGNQFNINEGGEVALRLWKKFGILQDDKISEYLNISGAKWRRIIGLEQDVELSLVLKILGDFSTMLSFFLDSVCLGKADKSLQDIIKKDQKAVKFEANNPFLCVIESLLESKGYRALSEHSDQFLANCIGVSKGEIRKSLNLLTQNESITVLNKKYVLVSKRVDMESSIEDSAHLAKFWTQMCVQRFNTHDGVPPSRKGWSYRIFPASDSAVLQIRQKIQDFVGALNNIIINDNIEERNQVRVIMLHHFDHHEFCETNKSKKIPRFEN